MPARQVIAEPVSCCTKSNGALVCGGGFFAGLVIAGSKHLRDATNWKLWLPPSDISPPPPIRLAVGAARYLEPSVVQDSDRSISVELRHPHQIIANWNLGLLANQPCAVS